MANEEYLSPDSEASAEIVEVQPSALAVITQSEYAAMVATANQPANKRKIDVFSKQLMSYATTLRLSRSRCSTRFPAPGNKLLDRACVSLKSSPPVGGTTQPARA